ncbi:hypothetical protein GGR25_001068 [Kaistia hirudinis]|uniref:Type II secretion system protein GspC N-terminal domain-containing protein n=1 Tax=Kaistia hirudinis TaxID=1293440 RepID=A0A840AI49_9HYPH|nr:hypothetical protein [Kaistia hirudinis]MBB3930029.1 hypothetical protein [Kaistia hirudinis]
MSRRLALVAVNTTLFALIAWPLAFSSAPDVGGLDERPMTTAKAALVEPQVPASAPTGPGVDLFRAAIVVAAPPVDTAPKAPDLRLIGVIGGPGANVAVLQQSKDGPIVRLRKGEVFEQWTVAEIARKTVTLEGDGVRSILMLDQPSTDAAAPETLAGEAQVNLPPQQAPSIGPSSVIRRFRR